MYLCWTPNVFFFLGPCFLVCASGCLLVAVALGLGSLLVSVSVASGSVSFRWCRTPEGRKGTDPTTGSDPEITLKLESGSFGGHPRG